MRCFRKCFWRTSRCLKMFKNAVCRVRYLFSIKTIKIYSGLDQIPNTVVVMISLVPTWWIVHLLFVFSTLHSTWHSTTWYKSWKHLDNTQYSCDMDTHPFLFTKRNTHWLPNKISSYRDRGMPQWRNPEGSDRTPWKHVYSSTRTRKLCGVSYPGDRTYN